MGAIPIKTHHLYQKIGQYCEELFKESGPYLIACSGGADSIFLLHFLSHWFRGKTFLSVYFDHGLRQESTTESDYVESCAQQANIPFIKEIIAVQDVAKDQNISLEMAGRRCRLESYQKLYSQYAVQAIVLGHHQDDYCETFLMKLFRGSKVHHGVLNAIEKIDDLTFFRPLLCVNKAQIIDSLNEQGIPFKEDPSNYSREFQRNYIRHDLIPLIHSLNPAYSKTIHEFGDYLKECHIFIDQHIEPILQEVKWVQNQYAHIPLSILKKQSVFVQKQVLTRVLDQVLTSTRFSSVHVENLADGIAKPGPRNIQLPNQWWGKIEPPLLRIVK